jgi:hypothetical protein
MTGIALVDDAPESGGPDVTICSVVWAIDATLAQLGERQLVPASEVVNLLLDLRLIATPADAAQ